MQIYEQMLKLAIICLGIIAIAMLFLTVGIVFGRRHTFRSLHIGQSKAMRQRGIHCVESMDAIERRNYVSGNRYMRKKTNTIVMVKK